MATSGTGEGTTPIAQGVVNEQNAAIGTKPAFYTVPLGRYSLVQMRYYRGQDGGFGKITRDIGYSNIVFDPASLNVVSPGDTPSTIPPFLYTEIIGIGPYAGFGSELWLGPGEELFAEVQTNEVEIFYREFEQ